MNNWTVLNHDNGVVYGPYNAIDVYEALRLWVRDTLDNVHTDIDEVDTTERATVSLTCNEYETYYFEIRRFRGT